MFKAELPGIAMEASVATRSESQPPNASDGHGHARCRQFVPHLRDSERYSRQQTSEGKQRSI
jgi:hypothetical protein